MDFLLNEWHINIIDNKISYRKFNLNYEDHQIDRTISPDISIFETDFGVKFGILIGFDLGLLSPMQQLIDQGIRNFVTPTAWLSVTPFATCLYNNI